MSPLTRCAGMLCLALTAGIGTTPVPTATAERGTAIATTITVQAGRPLGRASRHLLGVNHHYDRNGQGLWDPATGGPEPAVVAGARRAGVDSLRFPGGTVGSLYDWRRGIGDPGTRACQVHGGLKVGVGHRAISDGLHFGSDEFLRFVNRIDAEPLIMVPFVNGTASHAADWVEYLNGRAGVAGNPNGGVDWADVRAANGHPEPYGVRRWEIGNELSHRSQRFWMSKRTATAVRQYAFGDAVTITGQPLGKECAHPLGGAASDGSPHQVFETLYWPLVGSSVQVRVAGERWTRVRDLSSSGPGDRVFAVSPGSGRIRFGDGVHGAIPAPGATARATYRIEHEGFFAFARRMRAVDPRIKVCSAWGTRDFLAVAGRRRYSCLTTHAITSFKVKGGGWTGPLEGHDELMVAPARRRASLARLLDRTPRRVPLWVTESSTIQGDKAAFPGWSTSASHAVHMATLWGDFLELGLPWAMSDDLLWRTDRAVLGPAPDFVFTADAVTREAVRPMFTAGGRLLRATVRGNPLREPRRVVGSYRALAVTATRAPDGSLYVMVLNRLPSRDLTARVRLDGFTSKRTVTVRTVSADSFSAYNKAGEPAAVTLRVSERAIPPHGFTQTFDATSTTVFHIPRG